MRLWGRLLRRQRGAASRLSVAHFKPEALEARLRAALAGTHDTEPRPIAKLDLPLGGDRWLTPAFMKALRPAAVLAPAHFTRRIRKPGFFMFPG